MDPQFVENKTRPPDLNPQGRQEIPQKTLKAKKEW